ncbi:T9SS type A sorting domain-containing protein [Fulvivirga sp. 29W222]|uniref:T9SS type A sorting domain-containing protein n=1 Tax=Fulvivirga marina TaxID=2494733 RepID=A0A937G4U0_9BACT|nr:T9SS type A sorting domain-containing protein [Fulvivirga marina]MBL6448451.1 T9SS type A sorting domain-containing protein [Fulvivirga marina]
MAVLMATNTFLNKCIISGIIIDTVSVLIIRVTKAGMKTKPIVILTFLYLASYGLISQQIERSNAAMLNTADQEPDVLTANYIRTYPNPTTGPLSISMGKAYSKITVEIRSISGQLIDKMQYENTTEISTNIDAPSGIYLLRITGDDQHLMIYRITKE